jgi:hypothetical protein
MPLDYVETNWDRPRRLFYDWEELEGLGNALGGIGFTEIQEKMAGVNLAVIKKVLWYGFRHYDPQVKESHIPAIIAAARKKGIYLVHKTDPSIIEAISEALNMSEVFGENKKSPDEEDGQAHSDPTREHSLSG